MEVPLRVLTVKERSVAIKLEAQRRNAVPTDGDGLLLVGERLEALGLLDEARGACEAAGKISQDLASREHLARVERALRPKP